MTSTDQQPDAPTGRRAVWVAGLVVATGAGVATAHGLYQVAAAARVPTPIAWLYPLITDGLALVAYAATSRLTSGGRRYAASIVVLAAGLSGLAQATYLTGSFSAGQASAPAVLRFGVGAWPAIAAALTAHLLHLIASAPATAEPDATATSERLSSSACTVQGIQPYNPVYNPTAIQPPRAGIEPNDAAVQPARSTDADSSDAAASNPERAGSAGGASPASDRARTAARHHYARHGTLPTASELMQLAQVARGTAGTVLKDLRNNRPALHIVNADPETNTDQ